MSAEENSSGTRAPGAAPRPSVSRGDTAESYRKLLVSLRSLEPSENEIGIVSRTARWVAGEGVIDLIVGVPKWYSRWEVKEALYQNPAILERCHEEIGRCLAVINMMYELDTQKLSGEEKEGLRDDIRSLIQSLSEDDRASVKQRAHWLADLRLHKREAEAREQDDEEKVRARVSAAYAAAVPDGLRPFLDEEEPQVVKAALQNPNLGESDVVAILGKAKNPLVFRLLMELPQWYNRDAIRKAAWKSHGCPEDVRSRMAGTIKALKGFKKWSEMAEGAGKELLARKLMDEQKLLAPEEQDFVKSKLGDEWREFLTYLLGLVTRKDRPPAAPAEREAQAPAPGGEPPVAPEAVKPPAVPQVPAEPEFVLEHPEASLIDLEASLVEGFIRDRLKEGAKAREGSREPIPRAPDAEIADESVRAFAREALRPRDSERAAPPGVPPGAGDGYEPIGESVSDQEAPARVAEAAEAAAKTTAAAAAGAVRQTHHAEPALAGMSVGDRTRLARNTQVPEEIAYLLHDADPGVTEALVQNPLFGLEEAEALASSGTREKLEKLLAVRKWAVHPLVRQGVLHNPHTPQHVAQEAVGHVAGIRELMRIMRDPNIGQVDVKSKARARLVERYRSMSTEEKIEAIKATGGEIINDLWSEALYDERVLSRLFRERNVDEAILLKVARSRIAPRDILMTIGTNRAFTNNYQVRLELVQNPKTPREVSSRLIPTLNAQDRRRLAHNKNIPEYVRHQIEQTAN